MESRREKYALLSRFSSAVSERHARWYRLRTADVTDECLSFPGIPQTRLDAFNRDLCAFTARHCTIRKGHFSIPGSFCGGTELVQSQVKGGNREYFVRIGSFGTSSPLTASDQFASEIRRLVSPLMPESLFGSL
jgi:hypothetical protein